MANISLEFVERYQLEYEKNPNSRIFAPLAEAYRQMGLLEEAHRLCERGVSVHPEFAGGRVAFARVLLDMNRPEQALEQLEHAVKVAPDNLLAHSLLGATLITLRRPKQALKAYKMVLFLNPSDERAKAAVRKWEFLSADDYDDDLFTMKPVFQAGPKGAPVDRSAPIAPPVGLDKALSLADAFTVRGDVERAINVLEDAREALGSDSQIEKRLQLLLRRTQTVSEVVEPNSEIVRRTELERKRAKLEVFLQRINERRLQS